MSERNGKTDRTGLYILVILALLNSCTAAEYGARLCRLTPDCMPATHIEDQK